MNIVILSLIFSPDNVSTAQIMAGLAEDLAKAGNGVKVVSTTPHFHRDSSMEALQPRKWGCWPIFQKSVYCGIPVYHIPMPDKSVWPPLRMASWIWFHVMSVLMAPFLGKVDAVIACSPPLTIGLAAYAFSKLKRARFVYNVQELYPDIAVNLGKMKGAAVIRFFSAVERFIYRKSAAVTSITDGMCAKIRERVNPNKVVLIPNYVEIDENPQNAARANEAFTLTYAGNMGVPQNLGIMVEVARLRPDIRVLFVGGGQDEDRLRGMARGLANVEFRGYRPISEMPGIYAESDLFYVGQDPKAASDGIPSKIYRILGHKKPLAVVTAPGSDLEKFVCVSEGGVVVRDAEELAGLIPKRGESTERYELMGIKGFEYVRQNFSRPAVTSRYVALCRNITKHANEKGGC